MTKTIVKHNKATTAAYCNQRRINQISHLAEKLGGAGAINCGCKLVPMCV